MGYYYETKEYIDARKQLKEEYAVAFQKASVYIHATNLYGLENEESCLMQIMDDFLTAQNEGKPLYKITGPDLRGFCNKMMKAEAERFSGGFVYWLQMIPWAILLLSILAAAKALLASEEKMSWNSLSHIKLEGNMILLTGIAFLEHGVKKLYSSVLFHHAKLSRIIGTLIYVLLMGLTFTLLTNGKNLIPVSLPISLPFYLIINTLSVIAVILCILYRNKYKIRYKTMLREEDMDEIGKRTCPACGKAHDYDYPVCPYCKYRYPDLAD